jgi:N-acetylglucosaminyldiphosphoundecaprenol N-acetyl-beta-D-mannosaminyltransferase
MREPRIRNATDTPVWVWGLPLAPLTMAEAVDRIEALFLAGTPRFCITANLNYAMLCDADPRLREINEQAALILADGMPLVWGSRWGRTPLPERVAGADLVLRLCERGALKERRVFLLGGPPGVAEQAAQELLRRFPGLALAGTECPPFREWTPEEQGGLVERIRATRPDLLFVAFGQPKGELWIAENHHAAGATVAVQVGGSFDFITGRLRRAPRWMQRAGLEWLYRFLQEPRRLGVRYARNLWFLCRLALGALFGKRARQPKDSGPDP